MDHEPRMLKTVVGEMVHTMSPEACTLLRALPWRRWATEPEQSGSLWVVWKRLIRPKTLTESLTL